MFTFLSIHDDISFTTVLQIIFLPVRLHSLKKKKRRKRNLMERNYWKRTFLTNWQISCRRQILKLLLYIFGCFVFEIMSVFICVYVYIDRFSHYLSIVDIMKCIIQMRTLNVSIIRVHKTSVYTDICYKIICKTKPFGKKGYFVRVNTMVHSFHYSIISFRYSDIACECVCKLIYLCSHTYICAST